MKNKTQKEIERAARNFIERAVYYRMARPELDTFYFRNWYHEDRQKVVERAVEIVKHEATHV